jgi:hypothetical protein
LLLKKKLLHGIVLGTDTFAYASWCILPLRVTDYWKKEEQCLPLRELGKTVLQRVFWEFTILNFIGRYVLLNFARERITNWCPSSCRSDKILCSNWNITLKVYLRWLYSTFLCLYATGGVFKCC